MKSGWKILSLKEKIKVALLPVVANVLHSVGVSWKKIGRSKIGRAVLIAQGAQIKDKSGPVEKNESPLDVYFLTMLGSHTHNVSVDVTLGFGLKSKGHNLTFVLDDMCLPINEDKKAGSEHRWEHTSAKGFEFGRRYLIACGFKVIFLSEIVKDNVNVDLSQFDSIIEASLLKHYKVGLVRDNLPNLSAKRAMIEKSVNYTAQLGNYLLDKRPHRVIMSHGIYATWGPPFQMLAEANIPILTYSKTKRKGTEKFNWNYTADWWDVSEEWEKVAKKKLSSIQEGKIDDYLSSRITHKDDVLVYNFGELENRSTTIKRFGLNPDLPVISLFTNVLWDASSAQREIVFADPISWVYETIEWFKSHADLQLIIKIHPAEVVIGTNQPFADLIKEKFGDFPSNVKLIEPHENVNSWSIYGVTDLGLVHTTTAGLELPLCGVPCAVVSKTHYRGKGFTIDVTSKKEYFDLIANAGIPSGDSARLKEISKRYAYLLFERYQVPFKVFDEVEWTDVRSLKFNSTEELFKIPFFNEIIKAIETEGQFLTPA
jgi:hypothetical protein